METAIVEFFKVIGGKGSEPTYRVLGSNSQADRAMAIFGFGFRETLCMVTASMVSESSYFGSLKLRVGELSDESALTLQRLNDFLGGKFISFEPKGGIDLEESSEVWVEFDSISSFREENPIESPEALLDQLVVFFQEAQNAESALEDWQQDLDDFLLACKSSTDGSEPLQDPGHLLEFVEERDQTELDALANMEMEKLVFLGQPDLKFHSVSEAAGYLGENYPESLDLKCVYEGQTYFLPAAIQRVNDKVYGPLFTMSLTID
jgi:hypothetical protein